MNLHSQGYDNLVDDSQNSVQFQPSASSDNVDFDEESSTLASAMEGLHSLTNIFYYINMFITIFIAYHYYYYLFVKFVIFRKLFNCFFFFLFLFAVLDHFRIIKAE